MNDLLKELDAITHSVTETARILNVEPKAVKALITKGELPATMFKDMGWLIKRTDVQAYKSGWRRTDTLVLTLGVDDVPGNFR